MTQAPKCGVLCPPQTRPWVRPCAGATPRERALPAPCKRDEPVRGGPRGRLARRPRGHRSLAVTGVAAAVGGAWGGHVTACVLRSPWRLSHLCPPSTGGGRRTAPQRVHGRCPPSTAEAFTDATVCRAAEGGSPGQTVGSDPQKHPHLLSVSPPSPFFPPGPPFLQFCQLLPPPPPPPQGA